MPQFASHAEAKAFIRGIEYAADSSVRVHYDDADPLGVREENGVFSVVVVDTDEED